MAEKEAKKDAEKGIATAKSLSAQRNAALAEKTKNVVREMNARAKEMNKAQPTEVFNSDPFAAKHGHRDTRKK